MDVAGEALTARAADVARGTRLLNYYGPTECCVYATCRHVPADGDPARVSCIGAPLPGVTCHVGAIRGDELVCAPVGVWDELLLAGPQLADGYWRREEQTRRAFAAVRGRPAYRTGDRCRWRDAGELDYGGRIDLQVKLRGRRVELGEVERALEGGGGGCTAVALAANSVLAAFVCPPACAEGARRAARASLPPHMVPDRVLGIDEWPRTTSGKIDRRALQARLAAHADADDDDAPPPPADLERAVRDVLGTLLPDARYVARAPPLREHGLDLLKLAAGAAPAGRAIRTCAPPRPSRCARASALSARRPPATTQADAARSRARRTRRGRSSSSRT